MMWNRSARENTSETTSNSDVSEIAIPSLFVEWKQRGPDREMHQDPDRDRYTCNEESTVKDNAAYELELKAVSKRPTRLLPMVRSSITTWSHLCSEQHLWRRDGVSS